MPSPDSIRLRRELTVLLDKQMDTLARDAFGVVTAAELFDYELRQDRIRGLYAELVQQERAA